MQAKTVSAFGGRIFTDMANSADTLVSAPFPMSGNTVHMVLLVYAISGTGSAPPPTITATLEASVLGQLWDALTPDSGSAALTVIGGKAAIFTVTQSLVRVRITPSGQGGDTTG